MTYYDRAVTIPVNRPTWSPHECYDLCCTLWWASAAPAVTLLIKRMAAHLIGKGLHWNCVFIFTELQGNTAEISITDCISVVLLITNVKFCYFLTSYCSTCSGYLICSLSGKLTSKYVNSWFDSSCTAEIIELSLLFISACYLYQWSILKMISNSWE